eukprot:Sspe_Gene.119457::Locus_115380_Transcript_1_1_Confidence_1.000_Length_451::g.119457::m.119457
MAKRARMEEFNAAYVFGKMKEQGLVEHFKNMPMDERMVLWQLLNKEVGIDISIEDEESCCKGHTGKLITALDEIRDYLKPRIPLEGVSPSEKLHFPEGGDFDSYKPETTVVVDSFLYSEDDVDELCDQKKLSRSHCLQCG